MTRRPETDRPEDHWLESYEREVDRQEAEERRARDEEEFRLEDWLE